MAKVKPYQMYNLPHGASDIRNAAYRETQHRSNLQSDIIKKSLYGGKKMQVTVPSFGTANSFAGPDNPTTNSITGNKVSLKAQIDSVGDCYATGTCASKVTGGYGRYDYKNWYSEFKPPVKGGRKHKKKSKRKTKRNKRKTKHTRTKRTHSRYNKQKSRKLRSKK